MLFFAYRITTIAAPRPVDVGLRHSTNLIIRCYAARNPYHQIIEAWTIIPVDLGFQGFGEELVGQEE
jgi:hypothetical protein